MSRGKKILQQSATQESQNHKSPNPNHGRNNLHPGMTELFPNLVQFVNFTVVGTCQGHPVRIHHVQQYWTVLVVLLSWLLLLLPLVFFPVRRYSVHGNFIKVLHKTGIQRQRLTVTGIPIHSPIAIFGPGRRRGLKQDGRAACHAHQWLLLLLLLWSFADGGGGGKHNVHKVLNGGSIELGTRLLQHGGRQVGGPFRGKFIAAQAMNIVHARVEENDAVANDLLLLLVLE
mmetsp:Transcript_17816/g.48453  ORF Transcript_17816/g.48453 Transcript_17816/m.48453 type:complete len:230 (-) Transcript_17816:1460-2149(-)